MVYAEERRAEKRSGRALAGKALAVFLCVMAALTLANRALNELATPVVSEVSPQRGALEKRIDASGQVSAARELAVYAPAELPVGAVHVRAGQTVAAGEPLFTLDADALADALSKAQDELAGLLNEREKAAGSIDGAPDDSAVKAAEQALDRARQDLAAKAEEQDRAVALAQADVDAAQIERDKAESALNTALSDEYREYLKEKQDARDEAERTLDDKRQAYNNSLADTYQSVREKSNSYEKAVEKAQANYDQALLDRDAARLAYDRAQAAAATAKAAAERAAAGEAAAAAAEEDAAEKAAAEKDAKKALDKAESTVKSRKSSLNAAIRKRDKQTEGRDYRSKKQAYQRAQEDFAQADQEYQDALNKTPLVMHEMERKCESKRSALDSAQTTLDAKQTALQSAEIERDNALRDVERAVEDAELSLSDKRKSLRQTELDVANKDVSIREKQTEVAKLRAVKDAGGVVVSPIAGQLTACDAKVGAIASKTASAAKIGMLDEGLELRAQVSEDDAGEVTVGDEADITLGGETYTCPVLAVSPSADDPGKFELCFQLPEGVGQSGMNADVTYKKRSKNYDAIVPLSAVRQDDIGYFVYSIVGAEGALGPETRVERTAVQLLDKDSTRAAVSGGVSMRDRLVSRSDRALSDGDRVRVE